MNDKELEHADEILKGPYEPCEVCEGTGRIPGDTALRGSCMDCRGTGKHFRYHWFKAVQALGLEDLKQEVFQRHRERLKQVALEELVYVANSWTQLTTNQFVGPIPRLKPIINIPVTAKTPMKLIFKGKKLGNND